MNNQITYVAAAPNPPKDGAAGVLAGAAGEAAAPKENPAAGLAAAGVAAPKLRPVSREVVNLI